MTIIPSLGLMYARFSGHITVAEASETFNSYTSHKAFRPGQKHFVDFSRVTSFDAEYPKLFEFLANLDEGTPKVETSTLFVYFAPTDLTREMARAAVNAWSLSSNIVVRVAETEREAINILGFSDPTISALLERAKTSSYL